MSDSCHSMRQLVPRAGREPRASARVTGVRSPRRQDTPRRAVTVLLCVSVGGCAVRASHPPVTPPAAEVRRAFAGGLPALDGSRLRVTVLEVTYPPGGASRAHRHPCPVVGYVVRGALRIQVDSAPLRVYRVGESFYEPPYSAHLVSANASASEAATFLAWFVCDGSAPLSVPVTDSLLTDRHRP